MTDDSVGLSGALPVSFGGETVSTHDASKELRHGTSIHSSWSYFPDLASRKSAASSSPGATRSAGTSTSTSVDTSEDSLNMQRLQYTIETLERELKDPSSMRDRDSMYEELRMAKRELRGLKPWWGRFWG